MTFQFPRTQDVKWEGESQASQRGGEGVWGKASGDEPPFPGPGGGGPFGLLSDGPQPLLWEVLVSPSLGLTFLGSRCSHIAGESTLDVPTLQALQKLPEAEQGPSPLQRSRLFYQSCQVLREHHAIKKPWTGGSFHIPNHLLLRLWACNTPHPQNPELLGLALHLRSQRGARVRTAKPAYAPDPAPAGPVP